MLGNPCHGVKAAASTSGTLVVPDEPDWPDAGCSYKSSSHRPFPACGACCTGGRPEETGIGAGGLGRQASTGLLWFCGVLPAVHEPLQWLNSSLRPCYRAYLLKHAWNITCLHFYVVFRCRYQVLHAYKLTDCARSRCHVMTHTMHHDQSHHDAGQMLWAYVRVGSFIPADARWAGGLSQVTVVESSLRSMRYHGARLKLATPADGPKAPRPNMHEDCSLMMRLD